MKIAISDNNGKKFTGDIIRYWEDKGHEVKFETGANPALCQWADVYYVDEWDNNIHCLYRAYHGAEGMTLPNDWNNNKKPIIVCRPLDWTVWIGLVRDQRIIDWVDKIIVIAPHIEKELRKHAEFGNKIKLIRPGVNLNKFPLKSKKTDGFQIGMALGSMWWMKNHPAGLDIFTTLYKQDNRWRLHIRGDRPADLRDYWQVMYDHYLDSREIRNAVTLYPKIPDMNEFYENIDILLHPGQKEAFLYVMGESLAKGIPVVCNEFYGSKDIWPDNFLYKTHEEAINMILNKTSISYAYRKIIEDKYNFKRMMNEFDEYIGI